MCLQIIGKFERVKSLSLKLLTSRTHDSSWILQVNETVGITIFTDFPQYSQKLGTETELNKL